MQILLSAFGYGGIDEPPSEMVTRAVAVAAAAAEMSFDGLASGHHLLSGDRPVLQPIPLLARLAAETPPGFELSVTQILSIAQPVRLAEELATLSAINGGGVSLLAVLGYARHEFTALGIDRAERVQRFTENCQLLRALWGGTAVHHRGRFGGLSGHRANPAPVEQIPIFIGADADAGVRRSARIGNGWAMASHLGRDELVRKRRVYDATRAQLDASDIASEPETARPLSRIMFVADSDEEAIDVARPFLRQRWAIYEGVEQHTEMDDPAEFRRAASRRRAGNFLIGSPRFVRDEISAYREALGIDRLTLITALPGLPEARRAASVRLFAEEVLPALRVQHDSGQV